MKESDRIDRAELLLQSRQPPAVKLDGRGGGRGVGTHGLKIREIQGIGNEVISIKRSNTPSSRNNARVPNTESFVLAGCLHLGFPHADHRDGIADGVENFQFIAGLLTGSTRILRYNSGEISPAKPGFG
jgi:hypothetical protein